MTAPVSNPISAKLVASVSKSTTVAPIPSPDREADAGHADPSQATAGGRPQCDGLDGAQRGTVREAPDERGGGGVDRTDRSLGGQTGEWEADERGDPANPLDSVEVGGGHGVVLLRSRRRSAGRWVGFRGGSAATGDALDGASWSPSVDGGDAAAPAPTSCARRAGASWREPAAPGPCVASTITATASPTPICLIARARQRRSPANTTTISSGARGDDPPGVAAGRATMRRVVVAVAVVDSSLIRESRNTS